MATGTNGIATRGDLNGLLPLSTYKFWTTDLTKCPTKSDIMMALYSDSSRNYRLSVNNTYLDNQLVKYSDCILLYGVTINIPDCENGASFNLNDDWIYSNGIYTKTYSVSIDIYSGTTLIKECEIPIQFTATEVSNGIINKVSGQSTSSELIYFNIGTEITELQMKLPYDWAGISNGSIYGPSSSYPITDSCIINWQTITFEFT